MMNFKIQNRTAFEKNVLSWKRNVCNLKERRGKKYKMDAVREK